MASDGQNAAFNGKIRFF